MNEVTSPTIESDIREEPAMRHLLERMPTSVAESFTDEQLIHLKTAIGTRNWGKHPVDLRGTISLPFNRWRYYYVFLLGRNKRQLSDRERQISMVMTAAILLTIIIFCIGLGLLVLYLVKSASGIDLFPGFSFGIWDWFKSNF